MPIAVNDILFSIMNIWKWMIDLSFKEILWQIILGMLP